MKNIVVLISGNGSNLQAIIDACARKKINGTLRAVFSNKADAFGLERARAANIPAHALAATHSKVMLVKSILRSRPPSREIRPIPRFES